MIYDGLIMIDMWEPRQDQDSIREWQQSLLHRLTSQPFKCIVNACYNVAIDYQTGTNDVFQDRSQYNTMRIYNGVEENNTRHQKYQQNDQLLLNNLHNSRGLNRTSELIKREILNNDHSIFLTDPQDFVHHWQHVLETKVTDWLVIGQAWELCVHNRNIGLQNLLTLAQHYPMRFYGATWGFIDDWGNEVSPKHFKKDPLPWQRVGKQGRQIYCLAFNK
jgi:hypothetical protein